MYVGPAGWNDSRSSAEDCYDDEASSQQDSIAQECHENNEDSSCRKDDYDGCSGCGCLIALIVAALIILACFSK
jgi:hypothetical protein